MRIRSKVGIGGVGIFGRTAKTAGVDEADSLPLCLAVTLSPCSQVYSPKNSLLILAPAALSMAMSAWKNDHRLFRTADRNWKIGHNDIRKLSN
jgi:hypothetical protein